LLTLRSSSLIHFKDQPGAMSGAGLGRVVWIFQT
jgi:hypothetical protein